MGKGVGAHNGFVQRRLHADDGVHQAADGVDAGGVNVGGEGEDVLAGVQRHHHFFHGGVARSFAQATHGGFYLGGAGLDGGQGVGGAQPQVVVAVHRQVDFIKPVHLFQQEADQGAHFLRGGVAHRVRDVDGGGPGVDGGLHRLDQKRPVRAGGILAGELHIAELALGVAHHAGDGVQHLLLRHAQLILHMGRGSSQKGVDAGGHSVADGVVRHVNVLAGGTGQGGNGGVFYNLSHLAH